MSEIPPSPSLPSETPTWHRWLLPAILLIAFGIRLLGIGWGLPNDLHDQSYHPDEQVIWTYAQQIEPAKLDFTPGFYNYGTLYLTVMRVTTDVVMAYRGGPDANDPSSVWQFVGACHLAGRIISSVAGAIACALIFAMLRRVTHLIGACVGGLLAAFAPAWVVHSRFQTVDALAVCLLVASLYASVRLLDDPKPQKWALWAGVFAGLSTGTKYTGVLALLALGAALALRPKGAEPVPNRGKLFGLGAAVWLGCFFLATPGIFLETSAFIRDFKYEMWHTATGHGLIFERTGPAFVHHVINLAQGLHPLPVLVGFGGLLMALITRQKFALVIVAFTLPYYILIGRAEIAFIRYTLPLIVLLPVFIGWLAGEMHSRGGRGKLVTGLAMVCVGAAALTAMDFTTVMSRPDPRDGLVGWFRKESSPETTVGLVSDPWFYTPAFFKSSAMMRGRNRQQWEEMMATSGPRVVQFLPEDPRERYDWDIRLLTSMQPDFVVFSSFEVGPVSRLSNITGTYIEVDRFREFHTLLEADYEQVMPAPPAGSPSLAERYRMANQLVHDLEYVRPLYWVWKRKPTASPTP